MSRDLAGPRTSEWVPLLTVGPEPGSFSELSQIQLRRVTGDVKNPDEWLKRRMTVDVGQNVDASAFLNSPDSPFADPTFDAIKEAIPHLFQGLEKLSKMPLNFAKGRNPPITPPAKCANSIASISRPAAPYVTLRLQKAGGQWYFTEIRAMNEKRLRHLIAIANSFQVAD